MPNPKTLQNRAGAAKGVSGPSAKQNRMTLEERRVAEAWDERSKLL